MAEKSTYVTHVWVEGFVKKYRTYVYTIQTTWSDARKFEIYRRYADFFSLQNTLLQLFPIEAGKIDPNEKVIPSLPTIDNLLKLFGRTNSEAVMQSRLKTINHYCQVVLLKLDPKISKSTFVLGFFRPVPGDKQLKMLSRPASLHPQKIPAGSLFEECVLLADYSPEEGQGKNQLSVKAGEKVLVLNKDTTGWCLVNQVAKKTVGWVPEGFLRKEDDIMSDCLDDTPTDDEQALEEEEAHSDMADVSTETSSMLYHAVAEYSTNDLGQIGFPEGAKLLVIDQDEDGWWFASYDGKEGWVPSSFLEPEDASMALQLDKMDAVQLTEESPTGDAVNKAPEIVVHSEQEDSGSVYYTKVDYTAYLEDELSFPKGVAVTVLNKSVLGWWTVRYEDQVGLAPATFLSETPIGSDREHSSLRKRASRMGRPPPRRKSIRRTISERKLRPCNITIKDDPERDDAPPTASSPFLRRKKRVSPRNPPTLNRRSREMSPAIIEEDLSLDAQNGTTTKSLGLPEEHTLNTPSYLRSKSRDGSRSPSPTKSLEPSGEDVLSTSYLQSKSEDGRHSPSHGNENNDDSDLPADGGSPRTASPHASPHGYRKRAEDIERKDGDARRRQRAREKARSRSPSPHPGSKSSSPLPERKTPSPLN